MATMLNSIKRYNETTEKPLNLDDLPKSINADKMTDEELRASILAGIDDAVNGRVRPIADVIADFRKNYSL